MGTLRVVGGVAGAVALLLACGDKGKDPAVPLMGPTTGEAFGGVQCSSVRPQTEPDPMAWAAAPRVEGGMVAIPAGDFMMGSEDGEADEKPVHRVHVNGFSMDVTEVTASAYQACVSAGGCTPATTVDWLGITEDLRALFDPFCTGGKADRSNHPINCVSWDQATAYCGWAKKRLPTEEEWEYAARGTDGRKYPWGNDAPGGRLCWNRWSSKEGTCAVGSYPAGRSPFGLQDMAGNVWEWTASGSSDDYSKNRTKTARVYRGDGWIDDDGSGAYGRAANRARGTPSDRYYSVGFRCAR